MPGAVFRVTFWCIAFCSTLKLSLAADFPVEVKVDGDWLSNSTVQAYVKDSGVEKLLPAIVTAAVLGASLLIIAFVLSCCLSPGRHPPRGLRYSYTSVNCMALVGLIVATIMTCVSFQSVADEADSIFDATLETMDTYGSFVCGGKMYEEVVLGSSTEDQVKSWYGSNEWCDLNTSVGGYIYRAERAVNFTFDGIVEYIDDLSSILVPINDTLEELQGAVDDVDDLIVVVYNLVNLTDKLNSSLTDLEKASENPPPYISPYIPSSDDIPVIHESYVVDVESAKTSIVEAYNDTLKLYNDISYTIEHELQVDAVREINASRSDIVSSTRDLRDSIFASMADLKDYRADTEDAQTTVSTKSEYVVYAIAGYMVLLLAMVAFATWKSSKLGAHQVKGRVYGKCNCAGMYCCAVYLPLLAGVLALSFGVLDDSCAVMITGTDASNGRGLLEVNADELIDSDALKVGDTIVDLSTSIVEIARCPEGCSAPGSDGCDAGNNLVSLLGIQDEFNYNSDIQEPLKELDEAEAELNVTDEVASAKASLNSTQINDALAYDLTQDWNMSYYDEQFASLVEALPNSTDPSQEDKWQTIWQEYPPSTATEAANTALLEEVAYDWQLVRDIDSNLTRATELQAVLNTSLVRIDSYLDQIEAEVDKASADLQKQEQAIQDLVDFVYNESFGYLRCGWIGDSYKNVVEDEVCSKLSDRLGSCKTWLAAGAAMVYLSMFASVHFWQRVKYDLHPAEVRNPQHAESDPAQLHQFQNNPEASEGIIDPMGRNSPKFAVV